ncbi:hypothetical protein [Ferviditalea candida]|uniref:Nitroreductase domain-containing protein n=1 Tax=Ferviditalea candida TaxID=3108399 RepID=A0ABU5ZET2_9BACL|nr:hypothetical protein [Paenibacillaceae bacterium T2]
MSTELKVSDEKRYGPNDSNVGSLIDRIGKINWLSAAAQTENRVSAEAAIDQFLLSFGMEGYSIHWFDKNELAPFVERMTLRESPLWNRLEEIPQQIRDKAEETGRTAIVLKISENTPTNVFSLAFDAAFREFEENGEKVIQAAAGAMMYIAALACAWETLADLDGWKANPFLPLIQVLEAGHWPLGLYGGKFYAV